MKRRVLWIIIGVVLLALTALAVWASSQTPMIPQSSEAWSRGQVVGQTPVKRRVALQPALDGGVFMVWQNMGKQLELAHIGVNGEILLSGVLSVGAKEACDPQLQVRPDGRLNLLWREGEHPHSTVHYILLEDDGTPVSQPQILSDPAIPVMDAPQLILDSNGHLHAIWADEAGLQWAVLSAEGTLLEAPTLLASAGRSPAVQADDRGRLHLIWRRQESTHVEAVYYVVLDPESGVVGEAEEIAQIFLRTGQGLGEPVIGLTPETGYVLWTVQDFKYVASSSEYAYFPLEFPQQKQVEPLPLGHGRYPAGMCSLGEFRTPLLLALSESVPDPEVAGVVRSQITVITLGESESGEQVVTASVQASLKPTLAMDDQSHLHLAWLESTEFGRYRVVYASTAPEVMQNYNTPTLLDVLDTVFSNVFRLSTLIVALVAVLIMWAVLPFLGLVLYHLVTSEETLYTVRSRVALVVVLVLEVALTFAQPPRIGVEASWPALRWVAPAVTAVVTAVMMACIVRRRKDMHLFAAYFLFVGVNSLLQLVIYFLF